MLKNWWLTVVWALIIFGLSIMPGVSLPAMSWMDYLAPDKLAHAIVYGVFSYLAIRAYSSDNQVLSKHLVLAVLITSGYGVLMELIQENFFPHRFFEVPDIIANIIGSLIGVLIYNYLQHRKPRVT